MENKIYFKNKEEAYAHYFEIISEIFPDMPVENKSMTSDMCNVANLKGYIKQPGLQKAKDDFHKYYADYHNNSRLIGETKNYVDLMENEIENQLEEIVKLKKILQMYD